MTGSEVYRNTADDDYATLVEFLEFPLGSADAVFQHFSSIPNPGKVLSGRSPERFIYLPGSRENKTLLVAHADTKWNGEEHRQHHVIRDADTLCSSNPDVGLGADDRAGCAIIWLLKDLGHSILITDGEEQGRLGSTFLIEEYPDLADKIQSDHQFVIQFDRRNATEFKCYDVGSSAFRNYIASETGYSEPDRRSWTDIVTLCTQITGVNLSIGYRNEHTSSECLHLSEWQSTLGLCRSWLAQDYFPRFTIED
jgi:hypothetical protein